MDNPIELPSLEQVEKMDMEQQKWINALEISDDTVKCQECGHICTLRKGFGWIKQL